MILPIRTIGDLATGEPVADVISGAFVNEVRFVDAGAIAVGAVWTLLKMLRPIIKGITEALGSASDRRQGQLVDITQRDVPFPIVVGTIVVMLLPTAVLLCDFSRDTVVQGSSSDGDVERKNRLGVLLATGLIVGRDPLWRRLRRVRGRRGNEDPFAIFTGNDGSLA